MIVKQQNFNQLIYNVYQTHCVLKSHAEKAVDKSLSIRNWVIAKAITIASQAHVVQFDKSGMPYIGHVMRVMEAGRTVGG